VAKTEQELRSDFDRYSEREHWSAWLIVAALVMEAYAAWYFSTPDRPWYETTFLIAANLAIAAGVYGEIRFGRKADAVGETLQQISNEKVAEANARAAEASQKVQEAMLALARLTTPRTLTPERRERMTEVLKSFAGTPFDFAVQPEPEPVALMDQIADALVAAGWIWQPSGGSGMALVRHGKPQASMTTATGLSIAIDDTRCSDWDKAVLALQAQLVESNIDAAAASLTTKGVVTATAVHIKIGRKA
jgi:hypothetical protein